MLSGWLHCPSVCVLLVNYLFGWEHPALAGPFTASVTFVCSPLDAMALMWSRGCSQAKPSACCSTAVPQDWEGHLSLHDPPLAHFLLLLPSPSSMLWLSSRQNQEWGPCFHLAVFHHLPHFKDFFSRSFSSLVFNPKTMNRWS